MIKIKIVLLVSIFATFCVVSCKNKIGASADKTVVVYVALDQTFSESILELFEKQSGIKVNAKFDTELTKTTALVNEILSMKDEQKCDVFWNNEIIHTMRLKNAGITQQCQPVNAAKIPADFKDKDNHWFGLAARARVILVNKKRFAEKFPDSEFPTATYDLLDKRWGAEACIAKPLTGTTATHAATIFADEGKTKALEIFEKIKENGTTLCASNGETMRQVRDGHICWGLTDTDDAHVAMAEKGDELEMIYVDAKQKGSGSLVIPNTICMLKNAPNQASALEFINFVLSDEVEKLLAQAKGKQIPLKPGINVAGVDSLEKIGKHYPSDFQKVANIFENSHQYLQALFQ